MGGERSLDVRYASSFVIESQIRQFYNFYTVIKKA